MNLETLIKLLLLKLLLLLLLIRIKEETTLNSKQVQQYIEAAWLKF